jgi:hypothetical protein
MVLNISILPYIFEMKAWGRLFKTEEKEQAPNPGATAATSRSKSPWGIFYSF